jgi:hypothetical protein
MVERIMRLVLAALVSLISIKLMIAAGLALT